MVVKCDGCIYFTDPWTSPRAPEQWDLNIVGVYRITPDGSKVLKRLRASLQELQGEVGRPGSQDRHRRSARRPRAVSKTSSRREEK